MKDKTAYVMRSSCWCSDVCSSDLPATRFGLFAYPGAPYSLTLWAGKYYQFPIYENIFMNFNYLSIGMLRFYRDDKGESLAERGVSTMRLPDAATTRPRFTGLVG